MNKAIDIQYSLLANLHPTDRFLVECIRTSIGAESDAGSLSRACRDFTNWDKVARRAVYEGVIGWVHEILAGLGNGYVPDETLGELRNSRIAQTVRIVQTRQALAGILTALKDAGARHMVLKGPVLADLVYCRPDLRFYTDIDLLVREEDLDLVSEELCRLGYRLVNENGGSIFERGKTQAHYYREGSLPIDLHWQLINLPTHGSSITIDMDEIWKRGQPVVLAGVETTALSAEDMLLLQCAHMTAHHDFNRLLWFKDVEQVACRYAGLIDWDLFVDKAERYGLKTFVYYSLVMSASVCGPLPVPESAMNVLRPRYLMARLFERFISKSNILDMQFNRRRPAIEVWQLMRDRPRSRIKALAERTFPSVEWYLECYPFLPKIKRQRLYYCGYPALVLLRLARRPIGRDLPDKEQSR